MEKYIKFLEKMNTKISTLSYIYISRSDDEFKTISEIIKIILWFPVKKNIKIFLYDSIKSFIDSNIELYFLKLIKIQMGNDKKFHMNINIYIKNIDNIGYNIYTVYKLIKK